MWHGRGPGVSQICPLRPLDHHLTLIYFCSGTMYRPRDEKFFAIQHDSNDRVTKRKVWLPVC